MRLFLAVLVIAGTTMACTRSSTLGLTRNLKACPGFEGRRVGGADSVGIVGQTGVTNSVAPRYPTLSGDRQPIGRVEIEYVQDTTGRADMRTAWIVESTADPFTLAACEALAASEGTVATLQNGRRIRSINFRMFRIAPDSVRWQPSRARLTWTFMQRERGDLERS